MQQQCSGQDGRGQGERGKGSKSSSRVAAEYSGVVKTMLIGARRVARPARPRWMEAAAAEAHSTDWILGTHGYRACTGPTVAARPNAAVISSGWNKATHKTRRQNWPRPRHLSLGCARVRCRVRIHYPIFQ